MTYEIYVPAVEEEDHDRREIPAMESGKGSRHGRDLLIREVSKFHAAGATTSSTC